MIYGQPHFGQAGLSFWIAHSASLPDTLYPEPFRLWLELGVSKLYRSSAQGAHRNIAKNGDQGQKGDRA